MNHQNEGHHHNTAADSFFIGYVTGIVAAFAFRDSRHPVRDALLTLSAPFVSLLATALVIGLPLQPMQGRPVRARIIEGP